MALTMAAAQVFKQTSIFNVRSALQGNDVLMAHNEAPPCFGIDLPCLPHTSITSTLHWNIAYIWFVVVNFGGCS
jgi:hypothetical protein